MPLSGFSKLNIFSWTCFEQIDSLVRSQFDAIALRRLLKRLRSGALKFEYVDDTGTVADFLPSETPHEALIDAVASAFESSFDWFLAYHCCRPVDIGSYYRSGLVVLDKRQAIAQFLNWLTTDMGIENVTAALADQAFDDMEQYSAMRQGYTYYVFDHRYMSENCRHYFEHGGEYIQGIARAIDAVAGTATFDLLHERGRPTILLLKMPVSKLTFDQKLDLSRKIIGTWAYNMAHGTSSSVMIDSGIPESEDIPPDSILTHFAPPPEGTYAG